MSSCSVTSIADDLVFIFKSVYLAMLSLAHMQLLQLNIRSRAALAVQVTSIAFT